MKLTDAFHYEKEIIKNGKRKGYPVSEIKHSINTYVDILLDDGSLSEKDADVLMRIADRTSEIISGEVTADQVCIEVLSEPYDKDKKSETKKTKVKEKEYNYYELGCPRGVKRDRCGNIITDDCGSPVFSNPISRCGSSSSSSCGSTGESSRC